MIAPALHPQAAGHLHAAADAPPVATLDVAQARLAALGYLQLQKPPLQSVTVEHRFIPGPTADLPIRIMRTIDHDAAATSPVVVILHGSGWVIANLDLVDEPARVLAVDTGFTVITVNYQKAPEHPFPVPFDDCLATVRWVSEHADELGVDASAIAVVGDSAGGNLAAAVTAELTRTSSDDGSVIVAAQALLYPALDPSRSSESYRLFETGFGLDAADMAWFWRHYLGAGDADDPRVSPIVCSDVAGLPPTFIASASHDVLRDEAEQYAQRLQQAGIQVNARRYDGMIHGFWWMDGVLDTARELQLDLASFLRSVLRPAVP